MNKNLSFEKAMLRLEEILKALEGGESTLKQSLELFEEGVALVSHCNGLLSAAEQKITVLQKGEGGVEKTEPAAKEDA